MDTSQRGQCGMGRFRHSIEFCCAGIGQNRNAGPALRGPGEKARHQCWLPYAAWRALLAYLGRSTVGVASEENEHITGQTIFIDCGADVVLRGDSTW